ncbi:EamA family transporter [Gordonia insulae]|uniref:Threonine/homoserine exporter RhtA n=1 Tax=Gordonia insulae TaxID=2420509 RepID=A0A3G8JU98_9ACTN|nr:EamA family transporter [Gordonia insulae]AZG48734.1 Threonine/homoserine exporter RhtA [Gordonia insulae]
MTAMVSRGFAPAVMIVGATSMYIGAAVAVELFETLSPAAVAWLRIAGAAVVLVVWVRPGRPAWRPSRLVLAGAFGLITAAMNIAFYEALARLPLGTTVALEFLGPVAVAALGSRTRRDVLALLLAVVGVVLIADVRWEGTALGVVLALIAAACWAGYIVLGKRVAQRGRGLEDLATGFVVAALVTSPLALFLGPAFAGHAPTAWLLLLGLGLGVASTAIPYALDQVVLARVGRARFAILLALLPVTASIIGVVALQQIPTPVEAVGIVAVAAAIAVRSADDDEAVPAA